MIEYLRFDDTEFSAGPTRTGLVIIDIYDRKSGGSVRLRLSPKQARLVTREIENAACIAENM